MRLTKFIARPMTYGISGSARCTLLILSISLLTPAYALQGKEWDVLKPEFLKTCKKSAAANIPNPKKLKEFCSCYANEVVAGLTEDDVTAIMTDKGDATHAEQVLSQAEADCTMRQVKKSVTERDQQARFDLLPDTSPDMLVRSQGGVFLPKFPNTKVISDTPSGYSLIVGQGDAVCTWRSADLGQSTAPTLFTEFRNSSKIVAQGVLKTPEAQVDSIQELKIRNLPALQMEVSGPVTSGDKVETRKLVFGVVVDTQHKAQLIGTCITKQAKFEAQKELLQKMVLMGISARHYY